MAKCYWCEEEVYEVDDDECCIKCQNYLENSPMPEPPPKSKHSKPAPEQGWKSQPSIFTPKEKDLRVL